jgi:hypothetical protein
MNLAALAQLRNRLEYLDAKVGSRKALNTPDLKVLHSLKQLGVTAYGNSVFTVPWLDSNACQDLRERYDRSEYEDNPDEPYDAQIPEFVISQQDDEVTAVLEDAFMSQMHPIVQAVLGHSVEEFASIQLAVYEARGGVQEGTYHTDQDSDLTITVALNDDYEGGGLHVLTGGVYGECIEVPKQPAGTASIFKGKMNVHKGLPVTSGSRHLLVFWCTI